LSGQSAASVVACLKHAGAQVTQNQSANRIHIVAVFPGNSAKSEIDLYSDGIVASSVPNPTTLPQSDAVQGCVPKTD
jgi:hypothetical protein